MVHWLFMYTTSLVTYFCSSLSDYKQVVVTIERKHTHGSDQLSSVPVGRIAVLKHHKLSDIEPLIDEALKQYSNSLSEHRRVIASDSSSASSTLNPQNRTNKTSGNSLSELVQKELHKDSDSHLSVLKNSLHMLSRMDLSGRSIASYRIGNLSWKAGGLLPSMKSKNLFGMFGEAKGTISRIGRSAKTMEVTVTLKGTHQNNTSLIPRSQRFCSLVCVFYTECKLKNKKWGRLGNEVASFPGLPACVSRAWE